MLIWGDKPASGLASIIRFRLLKPDDGTPPPEKNKTGLGTAPKPVSSGGNPASRQLAGQVEQSARGTQAP